MTNTDLLYRRKNRIRARIQGTADRPRMSVYVSNRYISCQIVDDTAGKTLVASSSQKLGAKGSQIEQAQSVGADIAKLAIKAKVKQVAFDRNGKKYHGRIKALADSARASGLEF